MARSHSSIIWSLPWCKCRIRNSHANAREPSSIRPRATRQTYMHMNVLYEFVCTPECGNEESLYISLYINRDCISVCRCSCIRADVNSTAEKKIKIVSVACMCKCTRKNHERASSRRFLVANGGENTIYPFSNFIHANAVWRREWVQRFSLSINPGFFLSILCRRCPLPIVLQPTHAHHTHMEIQFDSIDNKNKNATNCICTYRVRHIPMLHVDKLETRCARVEMIFSGAEKNECCMKRKTYSEYARRACEQQHHQQRPRWMWRNRLRVQ